MNPKLLSYIQTREKRVFNISGKDLQKLFEELLTNGKLIVGGRAVCGNHVDDTWKSYTTFIEIVKKANRCGYAISTEQIPVTIRNPTICGGYWEEKKFILKN